MKGAAFALWLAGCAAASGPVVLPAAAGPASPVSFLTVDTLAGKWRVASLDGKPIDEPGGIVLEASDREIWWSPRCAGYARSYRIEGGLFSTGPYLGWEPPRPGGPPPLVCLIAPPREVPAIFDILASAAAIRRTAGDGVEISGSGRSLWLHPLAPSR